MVYPRIHYDILKAIQQGNCEFIRSLNEQEVFREYRSLLEHYNSMVKLLLEAAVKTDNIAIFNSFVSIVKRYRCERLIECAIIALGYLPENSTLQRHILKEVQQGDKSVAKLTISRLGYLPPQKIDIDMIKKATRLGFIFENYDLTININIWIVEYQGKLTKAPTNRRWSNNIQRLKKVLLYLLTKGKYAEWELTLLASYALGSRIVWLIDIYRRFLDDGSIENVRKITSFDDWYILKTKALRSFVKRESREGGSIDSLLYKPPHGLMVKRGLRECFNH